MDSNANAEYASQASYQQSSAYNYNEGNYGKFSQMKSNLSEKIQIFAENRMGLCGLNPKVLVSVLSVISVVLYTLSMYFGSDKCSRVAVLTCLFMLGGSALGIQSIWTTNVDYIFFYFQQNFFLLLLQIIAGFVMIGLTHAQGSVLITFNIVYMSWQTQCVYVGFKTVDTYGLPFNQTSPPVNTYNPNTQQQQGFIDSRTAISSNSNRDKTFKSNKRNANKQPGDSDFLGNSSGVIDVEKSNTITNQEISITKDSTSTTNLL